MASTENGLQTDRRRRSGFRLKKFDWDESRNADTPLSDNIRLLQVLPAEHMSGEIKGKLIASDIILKRAGIGPDNHPPPYVALSYHWGIPDKSDFVDVETSTGTWSPVINDDLSNALRSLGNEDTPQMIWVDAICINQDDSNEWYKQVRRMQSIYARANTVVGWLGQKSVDVRLESDTRVELGTEDGCVPNFASKVKYDTLSLMDYTLTAPETFEIRDSSSLGSSIPRQISGGGSYVSVCGEIMQEQNRGSDKRQLEMLNTLRHPWFQRQWVIQELSLAHTLPSPLAHFTYRPGAGRSTLLQRRRTYSQENRREHPQDSTSLRAPILNEKTSTLLAFDGGGIRGSYSLFILRDITRRIGEFKQKYSDPHPTSYGQFEKKPKQPLGLIPGDSSVEPAVYTNEFAKKKVDKFRSMLTDFFMDPRNTLTEAFLRLRKESAQNVSRNFDKIRSLLLQLSTAKRTSRFRLTAGKATLLSILLSASPAIAQPLETAHGSPSITTLQILYHHLHQILSLFTPPSSRRSFSPPSILAACLASTSITVLLFSLTHHQPQFNYFFAVGMAAPTLVGMIFAVDGPDFVFRYLFFGINLAMLLGVLYHRFACKTSDAEEKGYFRKEKTAMLG